MNRFSGAHAHMDCGATLWRRPGRAGKAAGRAEPRQQVCNSKLRKQSSDITSKQYKNIDCRSQTNNKTTKHSALRGGSRRGRAVTDRRHLSPLRVKVWGPHIRDPELQSLCSIKHVSKRHLHHNHPGQDPPVCGTELGLARGAGRGRRAGAGCAPAALGHRLGRRPAARALPPGLRPIRCCYSQYYCSVYIHIHIYI